MPGLLAARVAARVTLTDNNAQVVARLTRSLVLNDAECESSAALLEWGEERCPEGMRGGADVVLASDCVYSQAATARLFGTVAALLRPGGLLVLAYCSRWREVDRTLAEAAEEYDLQLSLAEGVATTAEGAATGEGEGGALGRGSGIFYARKAGGGGISGGAGDGGRTAGTSEPQAQSAARFWDEKFSAFGADGAGGDGTGGGTEWILPAELCLPFCSAAAEGGAAAAAAATLVIGCGDSDLSAQLHDSGNCDSVLSVDISTVAVERLTEQHRETRPAMRFEVYLLINPLVRSQPLARCRRASHTDLVPSLRA